MIDKVGGFKVASEIGRGGMSRVYRGRHATLGYPVAIKFLDPSLANDRQYIERFEREARQAAAIESPNIVRIIDFGVESGYYYIVMELVDGKDLSQILAELKAEGHSHPFFPAEIAVLIISEICQGLKAAHAKSIIHRDLKPSNILLDRHGFAKIVDFGLARDTTPDKGDLTQPGVVLGTPAYMSPEQAAGMPGLDTRCDIFSLGVVTYQLLSGVKPFRGERRSEIQEKIIREAAIPLNYDLCPRLTAGLRTMVERMLSKDKEKRQPDVGVILAETQQILDELDLTGDLLKRPRNHLQGFLNDPRGYADQLRQSNVSELVRRGLHLQTLGEERLADASQAFLLAQRLDPANPTATRALAELRRSMEESGKPWPGEPDPTYRTLVLPTPGAGAEPRVTPPRRSRWLWLVPAVMLLLVVAYLTRDQDGQEGAAGPDGQRQAIIASIASPDESAVPDSASVVATDSNLAPVESVRTSDPEPGPEPDAVIVRAPATPSPAVVSWIADEDLVVKVGDLEVGRNRGEHVMNLDPNRIHILSIRDETTFAAFDTTLGPYTSGEHVRLGALSMRRGFLEIFGQSGMVVHIDGRMLEVDNDQVHSFPIGVGDHELTIELPRFVPVRAYMIREGQAQPMRAIEQRAGRTRFAFKIDGRVQHKITCAFRPQGG